MTQRRRGAETRELIRTAAAELFAEAGYARTSVREIAVRAGSDPALVIRHSGSKELLFLDVVQVSIDDEPLLSVPLASFGERFVEVLLDTDEGVRASFLALVRGSGEPRIAQRLAAVHESALVAPLRARLEGPDADLRARLAASLAAGLLYGLWVVADAPLAAAERDEVVRRYGRLLQELVTPGALLWSTALTWMPPGWEHRPCARRALPGPRAVPDVPDDAAHDAVHRAEEPDPLRPPIHGWDDSQGR